MEEAVMAIEEIDKVLVIDMAAIIMEAMAEIGMNEIDMAKDKVMKAIDKAIITNQTYLLVFDDQINPTVFTVNY